MKIISKELLCEVLGYEVVTNGYIKDEDKSSLCWGMIGCRAPDDCEEYEEFTNIHELAHKCKEWAYRSSYYKTSQIESYVHNIDDVHGNSKATACVHFYGVHTDGSTLQKVFSADTEPEAVFKSCQWILEVKENS